MDQSLLHGLPTKPGVYTFLNEKGSVIYVGKAKNIKKRVSSYFSHNKLEAKTIKLLEEAEKVEYIVVGSEIEAFLLEANLIKKYKPFYNIKLSDDKFFPYLKISNIKFRKEIPYVAITRRLDDKNALYFGPYTNVTDLKIVLRLLRRIFPFQSVKNHPPRRCLYGHIGLCPCANVIPGNFPQYKRNLRNLVKFLKGGKDKTVSSLKKEQSKFIKEEEFEKAKDIQDKIEKIDLVTSENFDLFSYQEKPDFYYKRIEKELESLKDILTRFGMEIKTLNRIECYDISNISGTLATGSLATFIKGEAEKKFYRRFRIRFKKTPDDYAMLKEVISRRLKRDDWQSPDLMVIDGGKGQVSAVLEELSKNKSKIPMIGLAKKQETIIIPTKLDNSTNFLEVNLPNSTPGVNLLRRLRDEAHRFAITYHRLLRKKALNI